MDKNKKTRISTVEESTYGTYVWETDDKRWLADDEGRFLCVQSEKFDRVKIDALTKAARGYMEDMGVEFNGRALFLSGHRPVSDEQYEEQQARQAAGLTPDPFDVGAMQDDLKEMKANGRL